MTMKQAHNLMIDLRKSLLLRDYCEDIYLSIKNVGTKVFNSCAYFETKSCLFIWTIDESFVFNKKEVGDFVLAQAKEPMINLKKEHVNS